MVTARLGVQPGMDGPSANKLPTEKILQLQAKLAQSGIYKTLKQVLAENCGFIGDVPDDRLGKLYEDILGQSDLFKALPAEDLSSLAAVAQNVMLPANHLVYRPSDKGNTYYLIAVGSVMMVHSSGIEGGNVDLGTRGPCEGFGEVALLTDMPRSACVETKERTSLLLIPKDAFLKAVFSNPVAANACAKLLAERLLKENHRIVEQSSANLSYIQFISKQLRRDEPILTGDSRAILTLLSQIHVVTDNTRPVLVRGEPGTEMFDAASLIHKLAKNPESLLMSMDAKALDFAEDFHANINDPLAIELMQAGVLFGHGQSALPFAPGRRMGLLSMAGGGMVVIENIECLALRVQDMLADYLEKGFFHAVGENEVLQSTTRVIATSSADLATLSSGGRFGSRLKDLISHQTITVPPLRKRKKDIAYIVDALIKRHNQQLGKNVSGIEEAAYKSIMGYDWPGNTEELKVVIRRAVSIASADKLTEEDLFIGPPALTGKFTFNLLTLGPVMKFFQSRIYPRVALLLTGPFIALIIYLGLFGPQDPQRNAALALTWGIWEPMLMLSAFFSARMWCAVCPAGAVSTLARRLAGLNLGVPTFIRNYGFYLTAGGIAVIYWSEAATGMPGSPRATALLVLCIVALAAVSGLLFQRNAWCRYLCPLGNIVGLLSNCSILELRSNYGLCNNTCSKHDCYTGTEKGEGCPMSEGPFSLRSNQNCVICGLCIKTCPNQSPVLNLRLPGYDLWSAPMLEKSFAVLTMTLIGTQFFRGIGYLGGEGLFTGDASLVAWTQTFLLMAGSILLAALYALYANRVVFGRDSRPKGAERYRIAYALLPLAFACELGFHLEQLFTIGGKFLPILGGQLGLSLQLPSASASPLTVKTLQVLLVIVGAVGSLCIPGNMLREGKNGSARPKPRIGRYWPIQLLALAYILMFLCGGE
jgi:polyferredoxin/CRP-like cAMP-binding protein